MDFEIRLSSMKNISMYLDVETLNPVDQYLVALILVDPNAVLTGLRLMVLEVLGHVLDVGILLDVDLFLQPLVAIPKHCEQCRMFFKCRVYLECGHAVNRDRFV